MSLSLAVACVVLCGGLTGCNRSDPDTTASETTAQSQTPGVGESTAGLPTLRDYIEQKAIVETPVEPGDPTAPAFSLPAPPGWQGAEIAEGAFGALIDTDPAFESDPPSITIVYSKLTGDVDPAEVLKIAPNEIKNLPQFDGGDGQPTKLAGFEATQISGSYVREGKTRLIAQKTVVIPGRDAGLYVLQLNADALKDQAGALAEATEAIDNRTVIKQ